MSDKNLRVFNGATAIVTGGASGIGRAIGEELARRGCEVVLADLQIELAEEVASNIRAAGGKAEARELDVTNFSTVERLVQETSERYGHLDYMFNNAGIAISGPVSLHTVEDWNYIIDINLRGVVNGVQAAYKIMLKQGFGHIVNTASMAGLMPTAGNSSYATTKHAVVYLSNILRAEAAMDNVQVSVLCPGFIRTPILEGGGKYGKNLIELTPEQERKIRNNVEKFKPMPPKIFAQKALNAIAKGKAIIIIPSWYRLYWWLDRLSPSLMMFLVRKSHQAMGKIMDTGDIHKG